MNVYSQYEVFKLILQSKKFIFASPDNDVIGPGHLQVEIQGCFLPSRKTQSQPHKQSLLHTIGWPPSPVLWKKLPIFAFLLNALTV